MAPKKIVLAFDAYGTLLSTQSIANKLASHFGEEKAQTIAKTWRMYQLEYSWRATSMGIYHDFSTLTRRSLKNALAESSVSLDESQTDDMINAYDSLSTFPDVQPMMAKLKDAPNVKAVVFSNGTHAMVSSSVNNSPDLSPHAATFSDIVTVDDCQTFKPAPETYYHLAEKVGKNTRSKAEMAEIWLVSCNPFDVVGARTVGLNVAWVDRGNTGWQDNLIPDERGRPTKIVKSLEEVVDIALSAASE